MEKGIRPGCDSMYRHLLGHNNEDLSDNANPYESCCVEYIVADCRVGQDE